MKWRLDSSALVACQHIQVGSVPVFSNAVKWLTKLQLFPVPLGLFSFYVHMATKFVLELDFDRGWCFSQSWWPQCANLKVTGLVTQQYIVLL